MTLAWRTRYPALESRNYRLWAAGALVSNIGTWMQRTAQDWLVLTQLTHHNATSLGVVMALQYGPFLLLLPLAGFAADHVDRRRLLIATQTGLGLLALGLGVLTVAGAVGLWQVDVFAFLLGCVSAIDGPSRQTFVAELVGDAALPNAVALNSTSFNAAGMIGPAVAGVLIAAIGTGGVFLVNAASFLGVVLSLCRLRIAELHPTARATRTKGSFAGGIHYVRQRDDLRTVMLMLFLIGSFGLNFPIYISTMAVSVFHGGADGYGLLSSTMAIGTVAGALFAASRGAPRFTTLTVGAAILGLGFLFAALAPDIWLFGGALVVIGVSALTFTNASNALTQLTTEPTMRGRVMALRLGIALGGAPLGAPIVGAVADRFGPRWALVVGGAAGLAAAIVGAIYLVRHRGVGESGAAPPAEPQRQASL